MSWTGPKFHNPQSGETLIHNEPPDGTRELKTVRTGVPDDKGGHAVIQPNGNPVYVRPAGGNTVSY